MKKLFPIFALLTLLFTLSSCNEKSKLADRLTGLWTSTPQRIATNDSRATTTVTTMLTFVNDENSKTGGTVTGGAQFNILTGTDLQGTLQQPISVTANGKASISGEWEAIDDDEIMVTWDYSTLKVEIDPTAVEMDYNVVTGDATPVDMTLKDSLVQSINATMTNALSTQTFRSGEFDDIKFTNDDVTMTCETPDDQHTTFNKFLR